jgi:hypothetical protein
VVILIYLLCSIANPLLKLKLSSLKSRLRERERRCKQQHETVLVFLEDFSFSVVNYPLSARLSRSRRKSIIVLSLKCLCCHCDIYFNFGNFDKTLDLNNTSMRYAEPLRVKDRVSVGGSARVSVRGSVRGRLSLSPYFYC